MRYAVEIAYDGTGYHGWQSQDNALGIQEVIEKALSPFIKTEGVVKILGCGRTDAGVHASQYFFHVDGEIIEEGNFAYALNQVLDSRIAVRNLYRVPDEFNARFDAQQRRYRYYIHQQKDPFIKEKSWWFHRPLDIQQMNDACEILKRHENFASFCKSKSQNKTNICKISEAAWSQKGHALVFTISADRFLRNMVRAIVGTMIEVGAGKMNLSEFNEVIEKKDRRAAGFSVPARGLFLEQISYDQQSWKKLKQGIKKQSGTEG